MEYVYPAVFHGNDDGSYTITFPDLPGCISEGKTLAGAVSMAQSALEQWMNYLGDKNERLPKSSDIKSISVGASEFVSLVKADGRDKRAVKRTVSLPKWMDSQAADAGLSLSRVLQDALTQRLD